MTSIDACCVLGNHDNHDNRTFSSSYCSSSAYSFPSPTDDFPNALKSSLPIYLHPHIPLIVHYTWVTLEDIRNYYCLPKSTNLTLRNCQLPHLPRLFDPHQAEALALRQYKNHKRWAQQRACRRRWLMTRSRNEEIRKVIRAGDLSSWELEWEFQTFGKNMRVNVELRRKFVDGKLKTREGRVMAAEQVVEMMKSEMFLRVSTEYSRMHRFYTPPVRRALALDRYVAKHNMLPKKLEVMPKGLVEEWDKLHPWLSMQEWGEMAQALGRREMRELVEAGLGIKSSEWDDVDYESGAETSDEESSEGGNVLASDEEECFRDDLEDSESSTDE